VEVTYETSFGTLDYLAAPVVVLKMKNANSLLNTENLTVTYKLASHMVLMKPLFLSGLIFLVLACLLVSLRVDFSL
jgi:hypothetical protein